MELSFNQVDYSGDFTEFEKDDLIELVEKFEEAQDSNVAEFEKAAEKIEDFEADIEEYEQAEQRLAEEIAEETFLSADEAEALSFDRKREVLMDARESSSEDGGGDGDGDGDFEDMGQRGATHGESGNEFSSRVNERISNITGTAVDN